MGPLNAGQLAALQGLGELPEASLFWREGLDGWAPLHRLPELRVRVEEKAVEAELAALEAEEAALLEAEQRGPQ